MNLDDFHYYPLLKTTDAELKAYSNLDSSVQDNILPIFELTKSRRSTKNPLGKISIRLEQLQDLADGRPFIIDLTTEPSLSNTEIRDLLNDTADGFKAWREFVAQIPNAIPVIHYNENAADADTKKQAKELEAKHKAVAFRADAYDPDMMEYLGVILNALKRPDQLIIILDLGYVPVLEWQDAVSPIKARIAEILKHTKAKHLVCLSSSYPKTVLAPGYGDDESGDFPIIEVNICEEVQLTHKDLIYGDYSSIHPIRYPMGGGGWIPRIDVPLDRSCFYHRKRAVKEEVKGKVKGKIEDAYIDVAKKVLKDTRYKPIKGLDAWGDIEIAAAANGAPNGKSPSHWIAVRASLHITRQLNRARLDYSLG